MQNSKTSGRPGEWGDEHDEHDDHDRTGLCPLRFGCPGHRRFRPRNELKRMSGAPSQPAREENTMNTMIKIALAYARYALAAMATVGFGLTGN
jgi:hypothetical protein